ncbi:MAG: glycosyltransferase [Pirellulales bacterium]|nr:glycosyltransferase [Pirellulales bacterium]
MNVALVYGVFGRYHLARYVAARRAIAGCGELVGIEIVDGLGATNVAGWRAERQEDLGITTLFKGRNILSVPGGEVVAAVQAALDAAAPDVVAIPGWTVPEALGALQWATARGAGRVLLSATTEIDFRRQSVREWVKRRIVSQFDAALVGGARHKQYVAKLGVPAERIELGYDVVDNAYFAAELEKTLADASRIRRESGLPERYFLTAARFIPKKNLSRLLQAYADYRRQAGSTAWGLVIAGDGELRPALEDEAKRLDLGDHVLFPGFAGYDQMPAYYGLAGAYVQASTSEQWGLVVNEAMASGLPVLVSDRCGCSADLVHEGINGWTFDPYDVAGMTAALLRTSELPDDRLQEMSAASRRIVDQWGPDRFARGLLRAAESSLTVRSRRSRLLDRALTRMALRVAPR